MPNNHQPSLRYSITNTNLVVRQESNMKTSHYLVELTENGINLILNLYSQIFAAPPAHSCLAIRKPSERDPYMMQTKDD